LLRMPKMRLGRACKSPNGRSPSSIPMNAKNKPFAASANVTGKPSSRNMTSAANISGAKLWIRNSVMPRPPSIGTVRGLLLVGVRNVALQEGEPLHELGKALERQHEESD